MSSNAIGGSAGYQKLAGGRLGLRRLKGEEGSAASGRLLCFPFVGGHSLAFRPLADALPPGIEVWALDPPGHGAIRGAPLESVAELVALYHQSLPAELLNHSVLLGQSFGGYQAYHLAEVLLREQPARNLALILAASRPFHRRADHAPYSTLEDPALLQCLIDSGGMPFSPADREALFDLFKEPIRADFRAFEQCPAPTAPLAIPALALGGQSDRFTAGIQAFEWRDYLSDCRVALVDGGHFFMQESVAAVVGEVVAMVEEVARKSRGGATFHQS